MVTQNPSLDWALRNTQLDGSEIVLKMNPSGTAINGVDEERIPLNLDIYLQHRIVLWQPLSKFRNMKKITPPLIGGCLSIKMAGFVFSTL